MQKRIVIFWIILKILVPLKGQNAGSLSEQDKSGWQNKSGRVGKFVEQMDDSELAAQADFDAIYYRLNLTIRYIPKYYYGIMTGKFVSKKNGLTEIVLNMHDELWVDMIRGNAVSYIHNDNFLRLELDREYAFGEKITILIEYSRFPGVVARGDNLKFGTMDDGSFHVWTLNEPFGAQNWWPCKDSPEDKADSVDILVTVPDDQLVVSNGVLVNRIKKNNTITHHWYEKYPIATYQVSLAIGNYAHFQDYYHYSEQDSMLLDYYVYPSKTELAMELFDEMQDYLDVLSFYFGPYPFLDEKYAIAQVGENGGTGNQTLSSIGQVNPDWRYHYVHELAHQWFGSAFTCSTWQEIWLNEGFASYAGALYAEWAGFGGNPPGEESLHAYMNLKYNSSDGTIFIDNIYRYENLFNPIVSDKGSWFLHMLRHILGDETFFEVIKTYLNNPDWKYGSVTTENFKSVAETISGQDLTTFFNQWLYHPFYPEYGLIWEQTQSAGANYVIKVTIVQTQNHMLYSMPIDITIVFESGQDTTIVVQNNLREQTYTLTVKQKPQHILLDKNNWILKKIEYLTRDFNSWVVIQNCYPNPFREKINFVVKNIYFEPVSLNIYDLGGQLVRKLKFSETSNNVEYVYRWDGRNKSGNRVSSGVYFVCPKGINTTIANAKKIICLK